MKTLDFCFSSLAWPVADDEAVARALADAGVHLVELVPTKYWPDLATSGPAAWATVRKHWRGRGFEIRALQAFLFGKPHLQIFETAAQRTELLAFLRHVYRLAEGLGAGRLVFGAPKNRKRGAMPAAEAWAIAVDFFRATAAAAAAHGTMLCIEANPPAYGCDFITHATEAIELVKTVDSPGFGLHLDTAQMWMTGEAPAEIIAQAAPMLQHYHVSAPQLAEVAAGGEDYASVLRALAAHDYAGAVSIEMLEVKGEPAAAVVARVLAHLRAAADS